MPAPPDPSHRRSASAPAALDGPSLAAAFAGAATALARHESALNAINVFPVPDGDTGTNMALTMRAAVDAIEQSNTASAGAVAAAAAEGTLMGARGNSGVILSQIIAGLALDASPR